MDLRAQINEVVAQLQAVADTLAMQDRLMESAAVLAGRQAVRALWSKLNPPPAELQPDQQAPVASEGQG
jgi:hypothetical protein